MSKAPTHDVLLAKDYEVADGKVLEFPKGSTPWLLANTPLIGFRAEAWEDESDQANDS